MSLLQEATATGNPRLVQLVLEERDKARYREHYTIYIILYCTTNSKLSVELSCQHCRLAGVLSLKFVKVLLAAKAVSYD
jgi:hypothetical protein